MCLVVSEERGTLSVALRGDIRTVSTPAELVEILEAFYDEIFPLPEKRTWINFFHRNYREKLLSFGLALVLWIVLGYGAQVLDRTFEVPVNYGPLPSTLTVARIIPPKVLVTFSGQRKAFAFLKPDDIKLSLQLWDVRKGQHDFFIPSGALSYPSGLQLEDIEPRKVVLDIEGKTPEAKNRP